MEKILLIGERQNSEALNTLTSIMKMYSTIEIDYIHNNELYSKEFSDYALIILWFSISPDLELIRNITKITSKVLVISSVYTESEMVEILKYPIRGITTSDFRLKELVYDIEKILSGGYCFYDAAIQYLLNSHYEIVISAQRPDNLLTKREWEILEQVAKGYKNEQVAKELSLSKGTVSMYMNKIINKLEVRNKAGAVALALQNKWIKV